MRILNVKTEGVTLGVLTSDLELKPDLIEVTFEDYTGVPHTVYANKRGPFTTPEMIAEAWYHGDLHTDPVAHPDIPVEQQGPTGAFG